MKKANYNLEEIFAMRIQHLLETEKEYLNYFEKLSGTATIKELNASLSPERSEQSNHVSRLQLIVDTMESSSTANSDLLSTAILKELKKIVASKSKPSLLKDVQILTVLKSVYAFKSAAYSSLQVIAEKLQLEQPALLLEQSLEDSGNNMAYLIQIERNVIYPQFKS